jgi:DNA modification methylase
MFSEEFASSVIANACLPAGSVVLDPWLGIGTTTAAAAAAGMRSIGVDINPAMVAISRGRCLTRSKAEQAVAAAEQRTAELRKSQHDLSDPLLDWFGPNAARELRCWERVIRSIYPDVNSHGKAGFLLTSLFEAAGFLASKYRARNPTWVKRPAKEERVDPPRGHVTALFEKACAEKLTLCPRTRLAHTPEIVIGSSVGINTPDASVDLVLTSPPYCTRIDYAVSTRIELAVLGHSQESADALRDGTMGTSTIRVSPTTPQPDWGKTCVAFLGKVLEHSSKSSANYYYKIYLQYFDDLRRSLAEISRCIKSGGQAVIVIQDSYYKGIHTDLPAIVAEMGHSLNWQLVEKHEHRVTQTMRRVNTRSRMYRPDVSCSEVVLWFTKAL